ncbi:MAG: shikimate kinase [Lachnospiraceae bacterium]|nr:shikimate kinase [Lachnospiraceae bacterium]
MNKDSINKRNIILIGMPGVGKSSVGVVLAKILGYKFVDSDLLIQEQEGKRLHEIIDEKGIDGFLSIENQVNASIECDKCIVATGGSAVYGSEAMEHLSKIGTVLYLKVGYESLKKRLGNLRGRGVVINEGKTLLDLYNERMPLYEKYADITVDEEGCTDVSDTISKILDELQIY